MAEQLAAPVVQAELRQTILARYPARRARMPVHQPPPHHGRRPGGRLRPAQPDRAQPRTGKTRRTVRQRLQPARQTLRRFRQRRALRQRHAGPLPERHRPGWAQLAHPGQLHLPMMMRHRSPSVPAAWRAGATRRRRFCALALALLLPAPAQAQAQAAAEFAAKAAFIYNIALFSTFPNPDAPLVRLCVLGRDPFGKLLASLEGKPLGEATMTIAYPPSGGDALRQCQIVFVSASESDSVARLAQAAPREGVLTVSDAKGAARLGIMLELAVEDKRIAFEFNAEAARAASITLSSKVMRLARAVH
ncbi:DUF4154 domain-containing protein [Massilia sp. CCM 8694]|uniref:DUF4154 domain-containing protein n=2 Tax=Massilia genomosp. 1 TaxID=2609280 RepID=A0ABX0MXN3_9BURK|nr:DUF4154 domain-containing protein [Massilia genomosp. 1]